MIDRNLLAAIFILFLFILMCGYEYLRVVKVRKFTINASGMMVKYNGKKYYCTRDNGKTLKFKGVRDMAWKNDCKPA